MIRRDLEHSSDEWESTPEAPTRPRKTPGEPMWGMPAGSAAPMTLGKAVPLNGTAIPMYKFPDKPCVPKKTVVFDDAQYVVTKEELDMSNAKDYFGGMVEAEETERPPLTYFEQELRKLINKYSIENRSNTPDLILAEYLSGCLNAFNIAVKQREHWYGRRVF